VFHRANPEFLADKIGGGKPSSLFTMVKIVGKEKGKTQTQVTARESEEKHEGIYYSIRKIQPIYIHADHPETVRNLRI